MPDTPLNSFIAGILSGDRLLVGPPGPIGPADAAAAVRTVIEFEPSYRAVLPGDPPPVDEDAVRWATTAMYSAAALALHRDCEVGALDELLPEEPDRANASAHYSVDLVMRFLPELRKLASSASPEDPLVQRLHQWAVAWPLSSVGMPNVGPVDTRPLASNPTLIGLYIDRVLAAPDLDRLADEPVRGLAAAAIGDHAELCPQVASWLASASSP